LSFPTESGKTPTVLFKALSDSNYKSDLIISGNSEFIFGRNSSTIQPDGLSINAYYDYDSNVSYTDSNANWYNQPSTGGYINSFFTEPLTLENPANIDIKKYPVDYSSPSGFGGVAYRRSKLDGISIDFDADNYYDIAIDASISTIQQYNSSDKATNYEFNAILVYYDFYNSSNPGDKATNLYGILFLDNITPTIDGGYIETFQKFKPNSVTRQNGNSFGLSLNLKIDTSIGNSGVDTLVNEYNTFSMSLFVDSLNQLQHSSKIFIDQQNQHNEIVKRLSAVENLLSTIDALQTLSIRVDALQTSIDNSQLAFKNSKSLLDLIAKNSDDIQSIIRGNLPIKLQYNTDIIQQGSGIGVDKSIPNKIKITNKNQAYNLNTLYSDDELPLLDSKIITASNPLDLSVKNPVIYFELQEYSNMCRINTKNTTSSDIYVIIDDSSFKFKKGQIVRFILDTEFSLNNQNIIFYTDAKNLFGFGALKMEINAISSLDLTSSKPIFELICTNESTYEFSLDILK